MELLELTFLNNTARQWIIALVAAGIVLAVLRIGHAVVLNRLKVISGRTETPWDDIAAHILEKTKGFFVLVMAVYAASLALSVPNTIQSVTNRVTVFVLLIQAGIWASTGVRLVLTRYREEELADDAAAATTVAALTFIGRLLVWSAVLLVALDNVGVDVTTLLAGLGVGGIAVALAVQNILGDLFASLSIVLDKPFVLGDFLIVDEHLGAVEYVGLRTTRIRSLSGEQLVFSNNDLLNSRIRNFGRMNERRVVFTIGVTYQTPREQLKKIPLIIRDAVESQQQTRFDRSHFSKYGDFSLVFETVYYIQVPDYNTYMDIQQTVNLYLHERFDTEGIEFAYPTQTLFLAKESA
jgi:small-conductance mechanosensitive channel